MSTIDSTDDRRVGNNTLRHQYRELSDVEKTLVSAVYSAGEAFLDALKSCPQGRETALARTKIEEAVFWAVKGVTA